MNELIPFIFEDKPVRAVVIDGADYWVGRDVARALGYQNESQALGDHCKGVSKRYPIVDAMGRTQEVRVIGEPDVFRLITASRLPEAVRFEKWLFEEVLPQIRRTGAYVPEGMVMVREETINRMAARIDEQGEFIGQIKTILASLFPSAPGQSFDRDLKFLMGGLPAALKEAVHLRKENALYRQIDRLQEQLAKKGAPLSENEKEQIKRSANLFSVSQIARIVGRSPSTVRRVIVEFFSDEGKGGAA
jgi:prophage antirepressor-like protein